MNIRRVLSFGLMGAGLATLVAAALLVLAPTSGTATANTVIQTQVGVALAQPQVLSAAPQAQTEKLSAPQRAAKQAAPAQVQAQNVISPELPIRLEIPTLKINAKIQAVGPGKTVGKKGVEWSSPNNPNVGWHDYSARLGEPRNMVLNGHNNIYGAVFRKLYTLKAGDLITISGPTLVRTYQVEQVLTLQEKGVSYEQRVQNAQYIQPMSDDRLTLISCWPETNNTHRIVVIARPIRSNFE